MAKLETGDLNLSTKVGFNPTQEQIEEQIRQLPKIKLQKAVVLEFEDVAPRWNKMLKNMHKRFSKQGSVYEEQRKKYEQKYGVSLTSHKSCLVGEAHGFSREYTDPSSKDWCIPCSEFATMPAINAVFDASGKRLETWKQNFMKHYNEAHL